MELETAAPSESATCTICGLKCDDRTAFNAHIRAHLKDKLTNRRKMQQQQQQSGSTSSGSTSSCSTSSKSSGGRSLPSPCASDTVKRPKLVTTNSHLNSMTKTPQVKDIIQKVSNNPMPNIKTITNIQSLLPSSPLPMTIQQQQSKGVVPAKSPGSSHMPGMKDKPDLEALLSQLQSNQSKGTNSSDALVMAELAACKPIPPANHLITNSRNTSLPAITSANIEVKKKILVNNNTSVSAATPPLTPITAPITNNQLNPCTPEISDMEDDLMSYEMEMNRIDFHNDLAYLLDQIEKDFEGPCIGNDFRLDTPPDSDCEADNINRLLGQISNANPNFQKDAMMSITSGQDLLGFDRFSQRIDDNSSNPLLNSVSNNAEDNLKLVQSPASVAKVGKLPAKTLAVLNKLPAKLFGPSTNQQLSISAPTSNQPISNEQRFVDVVKVESSSNLLNINSPNNSAIASQLLAGNGANTQCIINIECRNPNQPAKIIQTFRAIDTGTEIKLVPANLPPPTSLLPPPAPSINIQRPLSQFVKNEEIVTTTVPEKKINNLSNTSHCPICNKCITNKNMSKHLEKHSNNEQTPQISNVDKKFPCKICTKNFSSKSHLNRHLKSHNNQILNGNKVDSNFICKVCGKICKNKVSLDRHKAKHLSCVHCSALFENKIALQDHLLKAHPEKAIVSLVQPPDVVQDSRLDFDDLGSIGSNASQSVDFSFSPQAPLDNSCNTIGESLADIADSNYFFCGGSDITDDLYSTDLFTSATTPQTC